MGFYFDNDSITPTKPSSGGGGSAIIEELNVTPTTSAQIITTPSGIDGYNPINVNAVTSSIDSNIIAENIKKDITILNVTGTYEGSGGGSGSGTTDVPLTRISDDNGNEIGTWYMNFEDSNGNLFKVIILDAQYRNASSIWCSGADYIGVTNMPKYDNNYSLWWYDQAKETATQNTQLILDFCIAGGYKSSGCTHCRSQSFTINGTIYYGQLPNAREIFDMWRHRVQINTMDTSASSYSSTNFRSARSIWVSNQYSSSYVFCLHDKGSITSDNKYNYKMVCPVLEIPV